MKRGLIDVDPDDPADLACAAHWDRVRAGLPPFVFPPSPPTVTVEVSANEAVDVERFRNRRREKLAR